MHCCCFFLCAHTTVHTVPFSVRVFALEDAAFDLCVCVCVRVCVCLRTLDFSFIFFIFVLSLFSCLVPILVFASTILPLPQGKRTRVPCRLRMEEFFFFSLHDFRLAKILPTFVFFSSFLQYFALRLFPYTCKDRPTDPRIYPLLLFPFVSLIGFEISVFGIISNERIEINCWWEEKEGTATSTTGDAIGSVVHDPFSNSRDPSTVCRNCRAILVGCPSCDRPGKRL